MASIDLGIRTRGYCIEPYVSWWFIHSASRFGSGRVTHCWRLIDDDALLHEKPTSTRPPTVKGQGPALSLDRVLIVESRRTEFWERSSWNITPFRL